MKTIVLPLVLMSLFSLCGCAIQTKDLNGDFFVLKSLYEEEILTQNDLINIAYRNNGGVLYDQNGGTLEYIPEVIIPIIPLDNKLLDLIKEDFLILMEQDPYFIEYPISYNDINVSVYCGSYHGYIALRFVDNKILGAEEGGEVINNLKFLYPYEGGNTVLLWKEKNSIVRNQHFRP